MSKSTYKNIRAQQRRITKRTNLFISQQNKLVNIGMAVFFLLLLSVATGLPTKITRSIHGSKPTNTISSSADNSITISPNKDNSVINIKTPASTTTSAAAPPTPTQNTENQPSYVAPPPIATPTLSNEQFCTGVNATNDSSFNTIQETALQAYNNSYNQFVSMNQVVRGSYPAVRINQLGVDYNNYVDSIYLTYTQEVQGQGCVPDLDKPPHVPTNYSL